VWFATHFGGGFASGRQLVDFYVKYGWYAVFTPILSVGLIALVLWCAWQFAVRHGVYDYHSWSVRYFEPLGWLEPVFSMLIEAMYLIILLLATGVAFATGGTVLNHIFPDIPYHVGTVGLAVLITGKTLGRSDEELGEILVKGFLGALSQLALPPRTVALMNEGVKLALFDSSSCDHLKNLERKGTNILVCGTCTNHFGITERVGVGTISNMFEILEAVTGADKVLSV